MRSRRKGSGRQILSLIWLLVLSKAACFHQAHIPVGQACSRKRWVSLHQYCCAPSGRLGAPARGLRRTPQIPVGATLLAKRSAHPAYSLAVTAFAKRLAPVIFGGRKPIQAVCRIRSCRESRKAALRTRYCLQHIPAAHEQAHVGRVELFCVL